MSRIFKQLFSKDKNIIIGSVHFPPLLGFSGFPGFNTALKNAIQDIKTFEKGGADAIIIENNYDNPHTQFVSQEIVASMTYLAEKIKNKTNLPVGISVLWNDYKAALSIAKIVGLSFIRIPVFVDTVKTNYGIIKEDAKKILDYRKKIGAEHVMLFTDIHVKHAKIISKFSITESARRAIKAGSDTLIITGNWTGEAPNIEQLKKVRSSVKNFPILCGSGINTSNVKDLLALANGAIVSTSLKSGSNNKKEVNVKGYNQRIDVRKVKKLTNTIKKAE